jgi:hypothetical protein
LCVFRAASEIKDEQGSRSGRYITIVETVSATGKIQPEIEVKIHRRFPESILLPVVEVK